MGSSKLDIAKAKLKMTLMSGGSGFSNVLIDEIPRDWENFPNTTDRWINIQMPISENSSSCMYKGMQGNKMSPHKHEGIREHLTIMNKSGSMTVWSDKGISRLKYPDSIAIEPGVVHAVEFHSDTVLMIVWHPMFKKGWEAVFGKEEENGNRSITLQH